MKYVAISALLLFGMAACAGPGAVTPKKGLMYEMPETSSVVYVSESSQDVSIDVPGMGPMNVQGASQATMALSFVPVESGVQVTVTFETLNASLSNPMAGPVTASESDIDGDLVFTLDERGRGTVVTVPEVKGDAEQLVTPASFAYEFFPRLPGMSVNAGDVWTDTIQYDVEAAGGTTTTESVLTYTLAGDTVVGGATLLHVTYEGETEVVSQVLNQGMEMIQAASGTVTGMFLWDPARSLMVFTESSVDLDGSVEVPAAGMGAMPLTVTGSGTVQLQGG